MQLAYRKTPKQLNDLAVQIVKGEVYMVNQGPGLNLSFGWIFALMDPKPTLWELETVGAVYEKMSKALPRGINGYPMFSSCQFVHVNDFDRLLALVEEKERALAGVEPGA